MPVEQVGPVVADGRGHRVTDLVEEPGLRDRGDAEGGHARHGGVVDDAGVLEAVAGRADAGPGLLVRGGERVEGGVDRAVADGVRGDRPPARDGLDDGGVQDLGVVAEVAGVIAIPVRLVHRRGARAQRPVEEDLHGTEAQLGVAEARAQPQVEAAPRAAVGVAQDRGLGHEVDAHGEVPALAGELVGGELAGGAADPPAADAGLGDVGDALAGEHRGGRPDRVGQVLDGVGPQEVAGQRLRGLEEDAGGVAGIVAHHDAAGGHLGRAVEDPGVVQHLARHRADVGGAVLEPHRAASAGAVERAPVRGAAEGDVVVAAADDEGAVRELGRPRRDGVVHRVEVAQPAERDLAEGLPEPGGVLVGVVEPRDHRGAAGTDDPAGADPGRELVVVEHGEHAAVVHGHRPPPRVRVVEGADVGVAQQQVDVDGHRRLTPGGAGGSGAGRRRGAAAPRGRRSARATARRGSRRAASRC